MATAGYLFVQLRLQRVIHRTAGGHATVRLSLQAGDQLLQHGRHRLVRVEQGRQVQAPCGDARTHRVGALFPA
jgi:hypothetical protein